MKLSKLTKLIRQSNVSNERNKEIGWVTWGNKPITTKNDQQTVPFSEGITIIKNEAMSAHGYKAYIVCVKEHIADEELTDAEDNTSDDEIATTPPKVVGRNLNSYRTSIPESPEMLEDSDNDSIISDSQDEFLIRNKHTRSPETPTLNIKNDTLLNSRRRSSSVELRLEDSTVSIIGEIKMKKVSKDTLNLANDVDIHDVLTQEILSSEVDDDDDVNDRDSEVLIVKKVSKSTVYDQETELSVYEQETEVSIHEQETEIINNKTDLIKCKIDKGNRGIRGKKYNIHGEETHGNDMDVDDNLPQKTDINDSEVSRRDSSKIEKLTNHKQQIQKLTADVDAKRDALMADSVICDFEVKDEPEDPDSPDSMSLLIDYGDVPPDKDLDNNCDVNREDNDPYNQDTQIMDPLTKSLTSQHPSHKSKCVDVNDDDELTQVMDEDIILSNPRNVFIAKTKITNCNDGKIDMKKNHKKDINKADNAFKKFKIPDETSGDIEEEDIFGVSTQNIGKTFNVDISGTPNTCMENLLDAPTQEIDKAPTQKFINISRAPTQNTENILNLLDAPTQEIDEAPTQKFLNISRTPTLNKKQNIFTDLTQEDILDAPTQKIIDDSDAPTPTLSVCYPQKVKNIKIISNDDIKELHLPGTDKDDFRATIPVRNINTRLRKRLSSTDFKVGSSLNSGKTSFAGTQELFDHLKIPMQSYITPMKRKILTDSNSSTDNFTFSTPAKIDKKKKGKVVASDASFNESLITNTINQLNSSTSSPKSIVEENYYNNTRELEDDLLSQTITNVIEKSPFHQIHKKSKKSLQEVTLDSLPSTNKNILIRSEDRESDNNYYGCTQEVMEDLLTQQNPNLSPIISPPKFHPKRKFPPREETKVSSKTKKNDVEENVHNENDYYQCTQDIADDLLTPADNKNQVHTNLEVQNSNEKCSNDLLFSKVPTPIKKNSGQLSESCSEISENLTPIKSCFKHTISDSELDSPQIKKFALRAQSNFDHFSNSDIEDEPKKDAEDDIPIVFRKTVPKRKQRRKSTIEEVKQTRSSSRVTKGVDKLIHSSDTFSKNNPKITMRRASVLIERCNDLNWNNLNKGGLNKATNDLGKTGKASSECSSSSKSKNDVNISSDNTDNESITEKNRKRGRKNVSKEMNNQIMVSDKCHSKTEMNESGIENIGKRSSRGKNKEKTDIINQENTSVNKSKKYANIKPIDDLSIILEPLTTDVRKQSKTLPQEVGSSILDINKIKKDIKINSDLNHKHDRIRYEGEVSVPEKKPTNKRTSCKDDSNTSRKDSSKVKEKSKLAINIEQKNLSDRRKKSRIEVVKQDNSIVKASRSNSNNAKITALKVMFTRLEDVKAVNCVIKLGGTVVEHDGDVLVSGCSKRTVKLMMALARGKPVVSPAWLAESAGSKQFLDPWKYLLKDEVMENRFNFCLKTSLETAKPYLKGWVVYLTPQILPKPQEMKDLVEASGGQAELVSSMVGRRSANISVRGSVGTFSVTCTEDNHLWSRLPRPLVKPEAIMMGAIKHTLLYNSYKLEE